VLLELKPIPKQRGLEAIKAALIDTERSSPCVLNSNIGGTPLCNFHTNAVSEYNLQLTTDWPIFGNLW
jgi:hypothetical protein